MAPVLFSPVAVLVVSLLEVEVSADLLLFSEKKTIEKKSDNSVVAVAGEEAAKAGWMDGRMQICRDPFDRKHEASMSAQLL
jgi:hypothetical protein